MKIHKKIYGALTLLGLLAYGTPAYSMTFARTAVAAFKREAKQFLNRMPVGAVAAYKQEQKIIEHFKTNELFLQEAVPLSMRNHITNLFEKNGLHVTCICVSVSECQVPFVAVTHIGSQVLFLMNDRSIAALEGKNKDGYTREHMLAVVQHELGHAVERHVEKQFLLESIRFPVRTVAATAYAYQNLDVLQHLGTGVFAGHSEMQWGVTGAVVIVFCMGKSLTSAYSRYCERQADQFVLKTNNSEQIKAYRDFLDILRRQVGDDYSSRTSSPPRFSERIEACDVALMDLQVVRKINAF